MFEGKRRFILTHQISSGESVASQIEKIKLASRPLKAKREVAQLSIFFGRGVLEVEGVVGFRRVHKT